MLKKLAARIKLKLNRNESSARIGKLNYLTPEFIQNYLNLKAPVPFPDSIYNKPIIGMIKQDKFVWGFNMPIYSKTIRICHAYSTTTTSGYSCDPRVRYGYSIDASDMRKEWDEITKAIIIQETADGIIVNCFTDNSK